MFLTIFLGAIIVTFNWRVLGAKVSFLQNVSMIGYCLFPLFLSLLLLKLLSYFKIKYLLISLIAVGISTAWCIFAAQAFSTASVPGEKKCVAMYPVFLFYIFIGSFVIYA